MYFVFVYVKNATQLVHVFGVASIKNARLFYTKNHSFLLPAQKTYEHADTYIRTRLPHQSSSIIHTYGHAYSVLFCSQPHWSARLLSGGLEEK